MAPGRPLAAAAPAVGAGGVGRAAAAAAGGGGSGLAYLRRGCGLYMATGIPQSYGRLLLGSTNGTVRAVDRVAGCGLCPCCATCDLPYEHPVRVSKGMERRELAAILRDVGNFSMDNFAGRLASQKTVRLLRAFGINPGYRHTWYLRGPYCRALVGDGHAAREVIDDLPELDMAFEGDAV